MDAALWAVCKALHLNIQLLPVYSPDVDYESDDDNHSANEDEESKRPSRFDPLRLFNLRSTSRAHLDKEERSIEWIGPGLETVNVNDLGDYKQSLSSRMNDDGLASKYRGIYWLNDPRHSEPNVAYITVRDPF